MLTTNEGQVMKSPNRHGTILIDMHSTIGAPTTSFTGGKSDNCPERPLNELLRFEPNRSRDFGFAQLDRIDREFRQDGGLNQDQDTAPIGMINGWRETLQGYASSLTD